jgi:hypothetical protein
MYMQLVERYPYDSVYNVVAIAYVKLQYMETPRGDYRGFFVLNYTVTGTKTSKSLRIQYRANVVPG